MGGYKVLFDIPLRPSTKIWRPLPPFLSIVHFGYDWWKYLVLWTPDRQCVWSNIKTFDHKQAVDKKSSEDSRYKMQVWWSLVHPILNLPIHNCLKKFSPLAYQLDISPNHQVPTHIYVDWEFHSTGVLWRSAVLKYAFTEDGPVDNYTTIPVNPTLLIRAQSSCPPTY